MDLHDLQHSQKQLDVLGFFLPGYEYKMLDKIKIAYVNMILDKLKSHTMSPSL